MIKICILSYWNAYGLNEKLLLGMMKDKIANLSLDMMELIQNSPYPNDIDVHYSISNNLKVFKLIINIVLRTNCFFITIFIGTIIRYRLTFLYVYISKAGYYNFNTRGK